MKTRCTKFLLSLFTMAIIGIAGFAKVNAYTINVANRSPYGRLSLSGLYIKPTFTTTGIVLNGYTIKVDPYHANSSGEIRVDRICDESGQNCKQVSTLGNGGGGGGYWKQLNTSTLSTSGGNYGLSITGNITVRGYPNFSRQNDSNSWVYKIEGTRDGLDIKGATNITGGLNVTGTTKLNGEVNIKNNLNISGGFNMGSPNNPIQGTREDVEFGITGQSIFNYHYSELNFNNNTTLTVQESSIDLQRGSIILDQESTIDIIGGDLNTSGGNANIKGNLTVTGTTNFEGNVTLKGQNGSLNLSQNNLNVLGNITITGSDANTFAINVVNGKTNLSGNTSIKGNLTVSGTGNIGKTLNVTNNSVVLSGYLSVGQNNPNCYIYAQGCNTSTPNSDSFEQLSQIRFVPVNIKDGQSLESMKSCNRYTDGTLVYWRDKDGEGNDIRYQARLSICMCALRYQHNEYCEWINIETLNWSDN